MSTPKIGPYELGEKIASGGMGDVFLARLPLGGNRMVALKVLHPHLAQQAEFVAMFRDEARLLERLSHPTTVQFYEAGVGADRHFIAMELLIGEPLLDVWEAHVARKQRIPFALAAYIGARVCDGLHHAHELRRDDGELENVVHRDVNPSNVFVTFDGRIKVIDFGLARQDTQTTKTATGIVKGKLAYLAPEVVSGKRADRRTDLFALATTIWEITTDKRLFKRDADVDTVLAVAACEIPDPRELVADYPTPLWEVVRRALARDPDARYATAVDMARALDACAAALDKDVGSAQLAQLMAKVCSWEAAK